MHSAKHKRSFAKIVMMLRSVINLEKSDYFFSGLNVKLQADSPPDITIVLMGIMVPYFGIHEFKLFIPVQRKLIGCGFKLWFGAARLGCVLWMEPSKGLNTKTSDGHREIGLGVAVVTGYSNVCCCN